MTGICFCNFVSCLQYKLFVAQLDFADFGVLFDVLGILLSKLCEFMTGWSRWCTWQVSCCLSWPSLFLSLSSRLEWGSLSFPSSWTHFHDESCLAPRSWLDLPIPSQSHHSCRLSCPSFPWYLWTPNDIYHITTSDRCNNYLFESDTQFFLFLIKLFCFCILRKWAVEFEFFFPIDGTSCCNNFFSCSMILGFGSSFAFNKNFLSVTCTG